MSNTNPIFGNIRRQTTKWVERLPPAGETEQECTPQAAERTLQCTCHRTKYTPWRWRAHLRYKSLVYIGKQGAWVTESQGGEGDSAKQRIIRINYTSICKEKSFSVAMGEKRLTIATDWGKRKEEKNRKI